MYAHPRLRRLVGRAESFRVASGKTSSLRIFAIALLLAGCSDLPTSAGPDLDSGPLPGGFSQETMAMIDQYRISLGCEPLRWHSRGAGVAESYSRQMSDQRFFGHTDPAGRTLKHRLNEAGITGYRSAAETIAAGQQTPTRVVNAWKASPEHHEIVKDCRFTHVSIGFHEGDGPYRAYWTALYFDVR